MVVGVVAAGRDGEDEERGGHDPPFCAAVVDHAMSTSSARFDAGPDVDTVWQALLDLHAPLKGSPGTVTLGLETFLAVYRRYDPEASLVGIQEGLHAIGATRGQISEVVFREWMAIMFAGCTRDEMRYGCALLLDAATLLKEEASSELGGPLGTASQAQAARCQPEYRYHYRYTDLISHAEAMSGV